MVNRNRKSVKGRLLQVLLVLTVALTGAFYTASVAFADPDPDPGSDPVKYKVSFNLNGGSRTPRIYDSQYVVSGECAVRPVEDPKKPFRTFAFWTTHTEDFEFVFEERPITEKTYLQARYWMDFYLSTYDMVNEQEYGGGTVVVNGGDPTVGSADPSQVLDHLNATFTAVPDEGYIFRGWWINKNQQGYELYSDDETITLKPGSTPFNADCKVQARFDYWDVTFQTNGGTKVTTQKIPNGGKATKPSNPSKTSFDFGGWYEDEALTKPFDFENTTITEDTTVYARWGYEMAVVSNPNEGQVRVNDQPWGPPSSEIVDVGDEVTLSAKPLPGYKFDHWGEMMGGPVSWDQVYKFNATNAVRLIAVFSPAWHVTYDADGGTTTNEDKDVEKNSTLTLPALDTFSKPGYRCANYLVKIGDESMVKYASEEITITGDTIIQAQWAEAEYIVDVVTASGDTRLGTIGIDTVTSSDAYIEGKLLKSKDAHEICAFPKDGFAFVRWEYKVTEGPGAGNTGTSYDEVFTIDAGTYADSNRIEFKAFFTQKGEKHSITAASAENGTIRVDDEAREGETVTITLNPDQYCQPKEDSIKVTGESGEHPVRGSGNTRTFQMPDEAVTVSGTFELIPITSIKPIDPQTIDEGSNADVTATIEPSTANPAMTWSSSDESIATVTGNSNTVTIEGKKAGEATVTGVSAIDSTKTVSFEVTVAHHHSFTHVNPYDATCTESGISREYWTCDQGDYACGKSYADSKGKTEIDPKSVVIEPLGHDYSVEVPGTAKEATCTEDGREADMECSRCESAQEGKAVPALGHTWDAGKVTQEATTTSTGVKTFTCTRCGATRTEVIPIPIAKASVSGLKAKTWTGKVQTQSPVVELGGKTLKSGTDYTVTYNNNKNVGLAALTITGQGDYAGTITKTFKINPKGTSLKKPKKGKKAITVKWKKQSKKMSKSRVTGYQIQLATNKKFTKNKKTVTVKGYKKVSKKVTKLKAKKTYYVKLRTYKTVKGKKYYSPWSKVKTIKTK